MKLRAAVAQVREQVEALEILEGYPLKPSFVGRACRHLVPETYSLGALGWTDKLVRVPDRDENGQPLTTVEVEIPDAVAQRHQGKTVRVRGRDVVLFTGEAP